MYIENKKELTISILIPGYNEEKSIAACIDSCINQSRPADEIIIVDDGSTDNTAKILASFGDKITVVTMRKNTGNKSLAQEAGLKHVKTDIFIATDADTLLDYDFVKNIENDFLNDKEIMAVSGLIKSIKHNWLTACREIEYTISQDIHKSAQVYIGTLLVIPGCAGAFRTQVFFDTITFDHDTLTEDLDFTYKYNKKELKIHFNTKAIVYTQDPATLGVYIKQVRRWYGGGWQNIKKHIDILSRPASMLELLMLYMESFMLASILFIVPFISLEMFGKVVFTLLIYTIVMGIYASIRRRRIDLFIYSPGYLILIFVNSYIFMSELIHEVILRKNNLVWYKPERRTL